MRLSRLTSILALLSLLSIDPVLAEDEKSDVIVLDIVPRVLSEQQQVVWEKTITKETTSGHPVVVKIEAENLKLKVTITPFSREKDIFLVVQGEVTLHRNNRNIVSTSVQSVSVAPGDKILFFPLGQNPQKNERHQMLVELSIPSLHE